MTTFPTATESSRVLGDGPPMLRWMGDIGTLLNQLVSGAITSVLIQTSDTSRNAFDVQTNTGFGDGMRSRFTVENNPASQLVDINLRGAAVNVGDPDATASAPGTGVNFCGPLGDTSNPIRVFKPGEGTSGVNSFRVGRNGNVVVACGGLATNAISVKVAADAQSKLVITEDGTHNWGPGGSTSPDTNLYRSAADILATDDSVEFVEQGSAPSAPAANKARLFAQDNGSGKTQLCVRFNTGAVQVLATEP